jgi:hypothetical protein
MCCTKTAIALPKDIDRFYELNRHHPTATLASWIKPVHIFHLMNRLLVGHLFLLLCIKSA